MSSHADAIKTNGLHLPDRRQVTALAYDLVGSTQLTFQLDPEDMGSVRRSFHDVCTKAVKRFEGYINGYAGDGAMAFFGLVYFGSAATTLKPSAEFLGQRSA